MPRVSTKKPTKTKKPRAAGPAAEAVIETSVENAEPIAAAPTAAVRTAPMADSRSQELQPPTTPVETSAPENSEIQAGTDKDRIATSLNIAKLQAMAMTELNGMAKDLGVENFGTMRKHEVIFHILQKNAERAGVLFSEGVLEVLPEGFGFLRSQSFNYLPCPEDIYVSPSQIRRSANQSGESARAKRKCPRGRGGS